MSERVRGGVGLKIVLHRASMVELIGIGGDNNQPGSFSCRQNEGGKKRPGAD